MDLDFAGKSDGHDTKNGVGRIFIHCQVVHAYLQPSSGASSLTSQAEEQGLAGQAQLPMTTWRMYHLFWAQLDPEMKVQVEGAISILTDRKTTELARLLDLLCLLRDGDDPAKIILLAARLNSSVGDWH